LLYLFPDRNNEITKLKYTQLNELQGYSEDHNYSTIKKGRMIGHRVSKAVIDDAETHNSNLVWKNNKTIPIVEGSNCIWNGSNPIKPMAGFWKTYILKLGSEFQPEKPVPCGSEVDLLDVRQTYESSKIECLNKLLPFIIGAINLHPSYGTVC
jgi:hypothetical protein